MEKKLKIGIFDSGVGGLTVLDSIMSVLPHEDFYYIADQGYCPYGIKTTEQIRARVEAVTRHLISKNVKAIVIACNTATVQIDAARAVAGDVPVIGVIDAACDLASEVTENKKVAVLATTSTVNSGVYQKKLKDRGIEVCALPCMEFVDFIENRKNLDSFEGAEIVENKLRLIESEHFDTIVHACTHFSLLERQMDNYLGGCVKFVSCGEALSRILPDYLKERDLLSTSDSQGTIEIYTTGDAKKAKKSMGWFKRPHKPVTHIDIED